MAASATAMWFTGQSMISQCAFASSLTGHAATLPGRRMSSNSSNGTTAANVRMRYRC
jgi:hypothetical protein